MLFAVTGIDVTTGARSPAWLNPCWIAVVEAADTTTPFDARTVITLAPTHCQVLVDDPIEDIVRLANAASREGA